MPPNLSPTPIGTIDVEGRRFAVSLAVMHDGIEYVGRLWFADLSSDDTGFPDRGAFPGRAPKEVVALATRLRSDELVQRFNRAVAEKRRYHRLRRVTEEMLAKIRYINHVAVSMRAGLLDPDGAAQEIELTERQLHDLLGTLRHHAGVESPDPGGESAP